MAEGYEDERYASKCGQLAGAMTYISTVKEHSVSPMRFMTFYDKEVKKCRITYFMSKDLTEMNAMLGGLKYQSFVVSANGYEEYKKRSLEEIRKGLKDLWFNLSNTLFDEARAKNVFTYKEEADYKGLEIEVNWDAVVDIGNNVFKDKYTLPYLVRVSVKTYPNKEARVYIVDGKGLSKIFERMIL